MFVGNSIVELVDHLNRRQASLWHACQLLDLAAYLALGGVPARSLVERRGLSQTPFATDAIDRRNGVWDKVFCNLDDFGRSFAAGWRAVPNPYGPIVLQIHPNALLESTDVAVTLRSAGAHDFDREGEALSSVEEVGRIYRHSADAPFPLSTDTRFGEELRQAFDGRATEAKSAEASISHPDEMIPLRFVSMVRVDPLEIEGVDLPGVVDALVRQFHANLMVRARVMGERTVVWGDLVRLLAEGPTQFGAVMNRADTLPATRSWMEAIHDRDLGWQFDRFAAYLREGTLKHVVSQTDVQAPESQADVETQVT